MPIKDYEGGEEDILVLRSLTKYLISLKNEDNVRAKIAQDFYSTLFPLRILNPSKFSAESSINMRPIVPGSNKNG